VFGVAVTLLQRRSLGAPPSEAGKGQWSQVDNKRSAILISRPPLARDGRLGNEK